MGSKKAVAAVLIVVFNKKNAEHNVANLAKCVVRGDAFVKSSVVLTITSIVQDYASIQSTSNVAGLLPVNSSVQHTKRVVGMELVVMLDQPAARKMVCGPVFHLVSRTVISNVTRVLPVILAV